MKNLKLIECPRDAMQGIKTFIPTQKKIAYINQLLRVGFDTLDFGSFVSPKVIPQMRDTEEVLDGLDLTSTNTDLLVIIANIRGAEKALEFPQIKYLGFPLSISETFQKRNTNKSIQEALITLGKIQELCLQNNKKLVTYISMGFGNPYGDPYTIDSVIGFVHKLNKLGCEVISLADTIGLAEPKDVLFMFSQLIPAFKNIEFGAHLHARPDGAYDKISAAYNGGCRRFDGAINGLGGCPMAKDELVGNIATEAILQFLKDYNITSAINSQEFNKSLQIAQQVFV